LISWKIQQKLVEDKNPELSRKEERKKKTGGKHGGGTQVFNYEYLCNINNISV
jgi:hypothetical protein